MQANKEPSVLRWISYEFVSNMDKAYSNVDINFKWQPEKCELTVICVSTLPEVYNQKVSPWMKIENATTEELKNQIAKCPSWALSFY